MPNTVIALKKSSTPSAVPTGLANGELAINFADGKLFYKNTNGNIVTFSSGTNSFGSINVNGTFVVADSLSDILTLISGTGISISADAINDTITITATGNAVAAFDASNVSNSIAIAAFVQANTARNHANAAFDKANSTSYTSNVVISVTDNTNAALRITQTGNGHAILIEDSTNPDSTPFVVDANGRVGIGTTNPIYNLEIAGSFAAQTKSFVINHQSKSNHKLRYGSLEGPENGVYVRGKANSKIIELPEYWKWLVDEDSITVALTPLGKYQKLFVEKIEDNKIYIKNSLPGKSKINCFYTVFAERKDVEKLVVEF